MADPASVIADDPVIRMDPAPSERLRSIQVLRAAAAVLVVLFHLGLLQKGYIGVDIFFVISGFIMGTIGIRERAGQFLSRRLIRIVPLYWAVTLTMCGLSLVPGVMKSFDFASGDLAKSLLFIPYFNAQGEIWPLVIPGWTLNFEMFFYALFALGLLVGRPRVMAVAFLAAAVVAGTVWEVQDALYLTYTSPLLIEFVAGLLLSCISRRLSRLAALTVLLLGVASFLWSLGGPFPITEGGMRILFAGIPAAILVGGAVAAERADAWPRLAPVEFIGDTSYALYLTHGLVLPIVARLLSPGFPAIAVGIAVSLIVAAVVYLGFERPVSRWLRSPRVTLTKIARSPAKR